MTFARVLRDMSTHDRRLDSYSYFTSFSLSIRSLSEKCNILGYLTTKIVTTNLIFHRKLLLKKQIAVLWLPGQVDVFANPAVPIGSFFT